MKSVIEFFYRRELLGNIITVLVIGIGILAMFSIRRDLFPPVDFDLVLVSAVLPGASPEQVEKLLVNPMEQAIREVDGIKRVTSNATKGSAIVTVELDPDARDTEITTDDLQRAIDQIQDYPKEAESPVLRIIESGQTPVVTVSIRSNELSKYDLREQTKKIADELERVPGVASVQKRPWQQKEILVSVAPENLRRFHVALSDVIQALDSQNLQLPGGDAVRADGREISVTTDGEFKNLDDVRSTVIRSNIEGYTVRISDVATVSYQLEDPTLLYRTNGAQSFNITIVKKKKADALTVVQAVEDKMQEIGKKLPASVQFDLVNRFTEYLKNRLEILSTNMVIGIFMVFVVLTFFLPFRVALIVALGIPFAMLATIATAHVLGLSINLISLIGLIIVCGMIVDDVVVVVENIFRRIEMNEPMDSAIINGAHEMVIPVTASVLTTIAAFSPLMFMSGIFGKFIFEIPLMVIGALFFSLLEGFLIAPVHFASFVGPKVDQYREAAKEKIKNGKYEKFLVHYRNFIHSTIRLRYLTLLGLLLIFGATLVTAFKMPFILFPPDGVYTFFLRVEAAPGVSLEKMEKIVAETEKFVEKIPKAELANYVSEIGIHQNDPNDPLTKRASHYAQIRINLVPHSERDREVKEVADELRNNFVLPKDAESFSVEIAKAGPPQGKPISINIYGDNFESLRKIAERSKEILREIPGVNGVRDSEVIGKKEVTILPVKEKTSQAGLTVAQISQTIRAAFAGVEATSVRGLDEDVRVRVKMEQTNQGARQKLDGLLVGNLRGDLVPLRSIAKFSEADSRLLVKHRNFKRVINVGAEVDIAQTTALQATKEFAGKAAHLLDGYDGYSFEYGGESEDTQESIQSLVQSFTIAAVIIFAILLLTFNSFSQPFLILLSIPLGIIGVVVALFLHGRPISFMASLGIVALAGVIVNNAIVFVDYFNKLFREGMEVHAALVETAAVRLRPIILTSVTTVCGLMPTAYGIGGEDGFIMALAISLGWGLAVGSALTIVAVPCLLSIANDVQQIFSRKKVST